MSCADQAIRLVRGFFRKGPLENGHTAAATAPTSKATHFAICTSAGLVKVLHVPAVLKGARQPNIWPRTARGRCCR